MSNLENLNLESFDFKSSTKEEVNVLIQEMLKLSDAEKEEALIYLIDNKVELDNDVPSMLQDVFHNEEFETILNRISEESNS